MTNNDEDMKLVGAYIKESEKLIDKVEMLYKRRQTKTVSKNIRKSMDELISIGIKQCDIMIKVCDDMIEDGK